MLRVEICDSAETLVLRLEGRFTGDDAEHIRTLTTRLAAREKLLVDLTEVVFVDTVGEEVLSFLRRLGAEFVAPNSYLLDVCERLSLPVAENGSSLPCKGSEHERQSVSFQCRKIAKEIDQ